MIAAYDKETKNILKDFKTLLSQDNGKHFRIILHARPVNCMISFHSPSSVSIHILPPTPFLAPFSFLLLPFLLFLPLPRFLYPYKLKPSKRLYNEAYPLPETNVSKYLPRESFPQI